MSIYRNQTLLVVDEELLAAENPILGQVITIVFVPEHLLEAFNTSDLKVALWPILSSNNNSRIMVIANGMQNLRWDPRLNKTRDR